MRKRQIGRQPSGQIGQDRERRAGKQAAGQGEKQAGRQGEKQASRQAERRHTDKKRGQRLRLRLRLIQRATLKDRGKYKARDR